MSFVKILLWVCFSFFIFFNVIAQDTTGVSAPSLLPIDTSTQTSTAPPDTAAIKDTLPLIKSPPSPVSADTSSPVGNPDTDKIIVPDTIPPPKLKPIDARFIKYKVYHSPDSLYFNVLKVKNNKEEEIVFTPKISLPDGWKHLFFSSKQTRLKPGDSAFFPFRVILPRNAKGGATYIISISLISEKGLPLERAYTYISIPKVTNWKITTPKRIVYLSSELEYEKFEVVIQNKGNSDEKIMLAMTIGSELEMYGSKDGYYSLLVTVPPKTDTTLIFSVRHLRLQQEDLRFVQGWKGSAVRINATSAEKELATTLWFRFLKNSFTNVKGIGESPLNIMISARNILGRSRPAFYVGAAGTILFCNNHNIKYSFYNAGLGYRADPTITFGTYLLRNNFMQVSYNTPVYRIILGDISSGGIASNISGKGIGGSYKFKTHELSGSVVQNFFHPQFGASLSHYVILNKFIPSLNTNVSYGNDKYNKINYFSGITNFGFGLIKGHSVGVLLGGSTKQHYYNDQTFNTVTELPNTRLNGFMAGLNYNGKFRKLYLTIDSRYSSKHFAPIYNKRLELFATANYAISSRYNSQLRFARSSSSAEYYTSGVRTPENAVLFQTMALHLNAVVSQKISFSAEPLLEQLSQNRYNGLLDTNAAFTTLSERIALKMNYRSNRYSSITPFIKFGFTRVIEYNDSLYYFYSIAKNAGQLSPYFNVSSGVSIRKKFWGVNINYYYGPYSMYGQQSYFYGGKFQKSIGIIPTVEKYFLDRKLRIQAYGSYYYDVGPDVERINMSVHLDYFFIKGWTIFVNNSISFYSKYDAEGEKFNNRSYYMDFGVKKSFNIQQPCLKFYNLTAICFNDMNGNRVMDENEKGLEYIMGEFNIVHPSDSAPGNVNAVIRFTAAEMITDRNGEMKYLNIPEGNYLLEIDALVKLGALFSVLGNKIPFTITDHTKLYVPFSIANKIIGKAMLIRDQFSNEGSLSIEGIRVSAQDSLGYNYQALTDKSGNFTLQVPKSGIYKVTIINPFGENFILEQDEFLVDFNGFKEYNMTFKFIESKRPINVTGANGSLEGSVFKNREVTTASATPRTPAPATATGSERSRTTALTPATTPAAATTPATAATPPAATAPTPPPNLANPPEVIEDKVPSKVITPSPEIKWEETNYYIVIGSFSNKANAEKVYNRLSPKDHAMLIVDKKGLYKIIYAYKTLDECLIEVEKRKSVFPGAWISRKMPQ